MDWIRERSAIAKAARFWTVVLAVVLLCSIASSCKWLSRRNYKIDKSSPTGAYRFKANFTIEDDDRLLRGFHDWGEMAFLKGEAVVYSHKWNYTDNFEPSFRARNSTIEWMNEKALFMGGQDPAQSKSFDELVVSNRTGENITYVDISLAEDARVFVFDLLSGQEVAVRVAVQPDLTSQGELNVSMSFDGKTASGKHFGGIRKCTPRSTSSGGPGRISLDILPDPLKQLRSVCT